MLELGFKREETTPVVKTVATEGVGIERLMTEIDRFVLDKDQVQRANRKKRLISWMLKDIITERIYQAVGQDIRASVWEKYVEKIYKREIDPYSVADEILKKIKGD